MAGIQGRKLETGTEAKATEKYFLLAWLPTFLYTPGPPVYVWQCPQWGRPFHSNN